MMLTPSMQHSLDTPLSAAHDSKHHGRKTRAPWVAGNHIRALTLACQPQALPLYVCASTLNFHGMHATVLAVKSRAHPMLRMDDLINEGRAYLQRSQVVGSGEDWNQAL